MKSIISTTYDDQYLFFLPIATWLWNKLNVDVICFCPNEISEPSHKSLLITSVIGQMGMKFKAHYFEAPKHKQATYAQVSRLYGACLDLPRDEVLICSDADMGVFHLPDELINPKLLTIFGYDLVPDKQYPMCYASGTVTAWRDAMKLSYGTMANEPNAIAEYRVKTYQEMLDSLLGEIEADHFRGNFWAKDQETLFNSLQDRNHIKLPRARPGTQFASNRIDRDDAYFMDRLTPDIVDYHFHRPGYHHIEKIISVIQYFYPQESLTWIQNYRDEYVKLL